MSDPQQQFVVHGSVQCLGTTRIDSETLPEPLPGVYEALAEVLGPHLEGWEHGDTIHFAVSSRPVKTQP